MNTTDTTALQERIARALYENAEYYGPEDTQPPWEERDDDERGEWMELAAAVLPIVAEEVRKAKAEALREASTLPQRFRAPEALARFTIENEWALDSEINPSGRADWHETLHRVHDSWDADSPEDIVSAIAAAIRLDRDFRTPHQEEVARAALTDLAESSLRTADLAAAQGDGEWEADARFVAREAIEHRDAHYPEETP